MSQPADEGPSTADTPVVPPAPPPPPPPAAAPPAAPPPPPPPAYGPPAGPPAAAPWYRSNGRFIAAIVIAFFAGALIFGGIGTVAGLAIGHRVGVHHSVQYGPRGGMKPGPGPFNGRRIVPQQPGVPIQPQKPRQPQPSPAPSQS